MNDQPKFGNSVLMHSLFQFTDDPCINLATEEYLLKNSKEDVFFLYRNTPSVIVGKHQNALAEVNLPYLIENEIIVARRMSGGGAVYHDQGNINFSFIIHSETRASIDFKKHLAPVIRVLESYGIRTVITPGHSIEANGMKISGNAQHLHKKIVLHHGTLLYDTNLEKLEQAINNTRHRYTDRAIRSVRSKVANLRPMLKDDLPAEIFMERFFNDIKHQFEGSGDYTLSATQIADIHNLANEKYRQWNWTYGYSPDYEFHNTFVMDDRQISVRFRVSKGIIKDCIFTDASGNHLEFIENLMIGTRHETDALRQKFEAPAVVNNGLNINFTSLIDAIF